MLTNGGMGWVERCAEDCFRLPDRDNDFAAAGVDPPALGLAAKRIFRSWYNT